MKRSYKIAALLGGALLLVVFGGVYNVAATEGHAAPIEWVLRTTMESSVENHAADVTVPETLDFYDRALATQFYGHYSAIAWPSSHATGRRVRIPPRG